MFLGFGFTPRPLCSGVCDRGPSVLVCGSVFGKQNIDAQAWESAKNDQGGYPVIYPACIFLFTGRKHPDLDRGLRYAVKRPHAPSCLLRRLDL